MMFRRIYIVMLLTAVCAMSCNTLVDDFKNGVDSDSISDTNDTSDTTNITGEVDDTTTSTDTTDSAVLDDSGSETNTAEITDSASSAGDDTGLDTQSDTADTSINPNDDTGETDSGSESETGVDSETETNDTAADPDSATTSAPDTSSDTSEDTEHDTESGDTEPDTESDSDEPGCVQVTIVGATSVTAGRTVQLRAYCELNNGEEDIDVTAAVEWASNATEIIPNPVAGLVKGLSEGTATVRATLTKPDSTSASGTHAMTVTTGELVNVRIEADDSTPPAGRTKQFTAYCDFTDRTDVLCTLDVKWASSRAEVATIDASGLATSHKSGEATISATLDGKADTVILSVGTPVLDSISILSYGLSVEVNATQNYSASCIRTDGTSFYCGSAADWHSSDESVLVFPDKDYYVQGEAFAKHIGTSDITATVGSITSLPVQVEVIVPVGCDDVITFPGEELDNIVRAMLEIPTANLYYADVMEITDLSADGQHVSDLTGIRCLTGLKSLSLYRNPTVSDISEVSELAQLTSLSLDWTSVAEIPSLHRLTELETITGQNMSNLTSIYGLQSLPNLSSIIFGPSLLLDTNGIYALSTLPSLTTVSLIGVSVDDLSYLVSNSGIGSGDQVHLYIGSGTTATCDQDLLDQLDELKARDVVVTTNCSGL